jgi:outer membrane protein assembly factor BamE (lipoprotein component of BamABCDE complex)
MKNLQKITKTTALMVSLSIICACVKTTETAGYAVEKAKFDQLVVGKTRKAVVERDLGSPSSVSNYGTETWYYISTENERIAFLHPKIKSQTVVAIQFNADQTIKNIEKYTEKDAVKVMLSTDTTPTEGHDMGAIGQMLSNIGRFNKDTKNDPLKPGH